MSLSHDDVQRLLQLLDASHFDELQLETGGTRLMLRRHGGPVDSTPAAAAPPATAPSPATEAAAPTGLTEVRAPMLGTFYGSPKPGAAPFVAAGDKVEADTVIGIVEVMKLMNPVTAGAAGIVAEVLGRDGELVEYDQVLLRLRAA